MFIKLTLKKIDLTHKSLFFSQKKTNTQYVGLFYKNIMVERRIIAVQFNG